MQPTKALLDKHRHQAEGVVLPVNASAERAVKRRQGGGASDLAPKRPEPASSLARAFQVLNLFTMSSPMLRIEDIASRLGYTRSTAYRYLKELSDAGLVTPSITGGLYSLGSRIVELERQLELTDPLYRAGKSVLEPLVQQDSSLLLQSLNHRNQVLCIFKVGPDILEHEGDRVALTRSRGVPFPLFRGAGSLVILASLSPHRIKQTYLSDSARIADAGLGHDWHEFQHRLSAIRRKGYAVSRTERKKPLVLGIAVPILLTPPYAKRVIGSIAQVLAHDLSSAEEMACVERLRHAAACIAQEYVELTTRIEPVAGSAVKGGAHPEDEDRPLDGWQSIT